MRALALGTEEDETAIQLQQLSKMVKDVLDKFKEEVKHSHTHTYFICMMHTNMQHTYTFTHALTHPHTCIHNHHHNHRQKCNIPTH